MPNERYGFLSNRQEFAGAMVMGCSLEKTLKTAPWCAIEINEFYDETEEQGTSKSKGEWLVLAETILELQKIAGKIRDKMHEHKPKNTVAYFNGFFDACEWVLGLLVEEGEK